MTLDDVFEEISCSYGTIPEFPLDVVKPGNIHDGFSYMKSFGVPKSCYGTKVQNVDYVFIPTYEIAGDSLEMLHNQVRIEKLKLLLFAGRVGSQFNNNKEFVPVEIPDDIKKYGLEYINNDYKDFNLSIVPGCSFVNIFRTKDEWIKNIFTERMVFWSDTGFAVLSNRDVRLELLL